MQTNKLWDSSFAPSFEFQVGAPNLKLSKHVSQIFDKIRTKQSSKQT